MDDKKLIKKLEDAIIKTLRKEGGASGLKPLKKAVEKLDKPKKFNLVKFLSKMKNVKKHKDSDYILVPINENTLTKLDIKNLIKQSIKEIQENTFYGNREQPSQLSTGTKVSVPTDEYPFSRKPKRTATGMMEFEQPKSFDPDTLSLVREMLSVADIHHDELVDDADTGEVSSFLDKRSGGTIFKFPHFNGPQGRGALFGKETTDQIDASKAKAKAAALKVYTKFKDYIEDYEISDVSSAGVYGNIYLFVMFNDLAKDYSAPKGGTQSSQFENTGIGEDSIRINSIGEQEQQGEEEKEKKPKVKENPPKHSLEKIGECKAGCVDLEIDNLKVKVENVELKMKDLASRRVDAKPSEVEGMEKERKEFLIQINTLDDQIKAKETEKKKLLNPEKDQNESKIKINMKANVKKLWTDYANSRISSSITEKMNEHKKAARRKMLQEGVMNKFFEYFDQGHTNEEIVQLYAGKGVNVPEQFVAKARKQHEQYSKMKFELEMSEKAFKNEASQIVNNPATNEMDMLDDEKQLASGLFKEQEEKEKTPEKSDVKAMDDEIKNINTPEEYTAILNKILDHSKTISGITDTKLKGMLMSKVKEL
tara:strand:- start:239 stop:2020 length:1782 start_codon:yes stop_codon:yes gene_type:complete